MQPSPIHLMEMYYLGISVVPQFPQNADEVPSPGFARGFDFNGVNIGETIKFNIFSTKNNELTYGVNLRIVISNNEGKIAPYAIDIEASGLFVISESVPKEKHEEMAIVNGCAILYSAIREQVMTITSRCYGGLFILPTVNFLDKIKKENNQNMTSEQSRGIKKKRTSKSAP